jgi:copper chaperone CopZ
MKTVILSIVASFLFLVSPQLTIAHQKDGIEKVNLRVNNLHCNSDMPMIKERLLKQDGVMDVTFTQRQGGSAVFTIKYHTGVVDRQAIEKQIESTPGCTDKTQTPYRVAKENVKKGKN